MLKSLSTLLLGTILLATPALAGNSGVIVQSGGVNTAEASQNGLIIVPTIVVDKAGVDQFEADLKAKIGS